MSHRLLVTGFAPFSNHEENISEQIIDVLAKIVIPGAKIETSLLSVDEDGSKETSERLYNGERFDAILHLGLSENAENIRLERFAKNRYDMKIPDNSGRQISEGDISLGSSPIVETLVQIGEIDEIVDEFEEVCWSDDPGGFICNETYYRSLKAANESYPLPILFVHLPRSDRISKRRQLEVVERICSILCTNPK